MRWKWAGNTEQPTFLLFLDVPGTSHLIMPDGRWSNLRADVKHIATDTFNSIPFVSEGKAVLRDAEDVVQLESDIIGDASGITDVHYSDREWKREKKVKYRKSKQHRKRRPSMHRRIIPIEKMPMHKSMHSGYRRYGKRRYSRRRYRAKRRYRAYRRYGRRVRKHAIKLHEPKQHRTSLDLRLMNVGSTQVELLPQTTGTSPNPSTEYALQLDLSNIAMSVMDATTGEQQLTRDLTKRRGFEIHVHGISIEGVLKQQEFSRDTVVRFLLLQTKQRGLDHINDGRIFRDDTLTSIANNVDIKDVPTFRRINAAVSKNHFRVLMDKKIGLHSNDVVEHTGNVQHVRLWLPIKQMWRYENSTTTTCMKKTLLYVHNVNKSLGDTANIINFNGRVTVYFRDPV